MKWNINEQCNQYFKNVPVAYLSERYNREKAEKANNKEKSYNPP